MAEVDEVTARLRSVGDRAYPALEAIGSKAGVNIKNQMVSDIGPRRRMKHLSSTLEYEVKQWRPIGIEVEVGFRKQGQGNLGNIAAFGTARTAPIFDLTHGLRLEVPRFIEHAVKALAEAAIQ